MLRFFDLGPEGQENWRRRLVKDLNSLAQLIQGNVVFEGDLSVPGDLTVTGSLTLGGVEVHLPVTFGPVATTSGTSVSLITTIPSWVGHVRLNPVDISTNGTGSIIIQPGTSGGLITSNYNGSAMRFTGASNDGEVFGNGFKIVSNVVSGADHTGTVNLWKIPGTNIWVCDSRMARSDGTNRYTISGGWVDLGGALTQITITTGPGSDAFNSGAVSGTYYVQ